jgi:ADP-ribose pyrophosphatase
MGYGPPGFRRVFIACVQRGGRPLGERDGPRVGRVGGRPVYEGRMLTVQLDRVRFPDGSEGELEIIRHPGAAAVLPLFRPEEWEGTGHGVVLLRQYRYAAGGVVWEVPAGKLDGGEPPEACALRELEEEAGLRARELVRLTRIFTTPGFTDEAIHLFLARGLEPGEPDHEASEFIERRVIPLAEAVRLVQSGEIADSKTMCALLYAAAFVPALGDELTGLRGPEAAP